MNIKGVRQIVRREIRDAGIGRLTRLNDPFQTGDLVRALARRFPEAQIDKVKLSKAVQGKFWLRSALNRVLPGQLLGKTFDANEVELFASLRKTAQARVLSEFNDPDRAKNMMQAFFNTNPKKAASFLWKIRQDPNLFSVAVFGHTQKVAVSEQADDFVLKIFDFCDQEGGINLDIISALMRNHNKILANAINKLPDEKVHAIFEGIRYGFSGTDYVAIRNMVSMLNYQKANPLFLKLVKVGLLTEDDLKSDDTIGTLLQKMATIETNKKMVMDLEDGKPMFPW
jgi:hypothetical protein